MTTVIIIGFTLITGAIYCYYHFYAKTMILIMNPISDVKTFKTSIDSYLSTCNNHNSPTRLRVTTGVATTLMECSE